jgi:hypothetical protein
MEDKKSEKKIYRRNTIGKKNKECKNGGRNIEKREK